MSEAEKENAAPDATGAGGDRPGSSGAEGGERKTMWELYIKNVGVGRLYWLYFLTFVAPWRVRELALRIEAFDETPE